MAYQLACGSQDALNREAFARSLREPSLQNIMIKRHEIWDLWEKHGELSNILPNDSVGY